jgi:hypothetical protein
MIPFILAAVGGYLIGDSMKSSQFADGGRLSEYSNDALTDMIINLSRYEDNKEIIDSVKEELERRKSKTAKLDLDKVSNVVVDGIDYDDYPDFSDAYISQADYDGIPMTEEQLDELNENLEFVHESVFEQIN